MNKTTVFNFIPAIFAIIIASALFKNFDRSTGEFDNPALAIIYAIALLMAIYFIFTNGKKNADKTWIANYDNNIVKIRNTSFSGEELHVNEELQDKRYGVFSSDLSGHLLNSKNEKELIKANISGMMKVKCFLFINDKKVPVTEEKMS